MSWKLTHISHQEWKISSCILDEFFKWVNIFSCTLYASRQTSCFGQGYDGKFNSEEHYIYYLGKESLRRNGVTLIVSKSLKCSTWVQGKVMTEWSWFTSKANHSTSKIKDTALLTKVYLVKAVVFPVVMCGCESWTIRKAEHWRIDALELWCWRRLLRVPWTVRRSNQSILK